MKKLQKIAEISEEVLKKISKVFKYIFYFALIFFIVSLIFFPERSDLYWQVSVLTAIAEVLCGSAAILIRQLYQQILIIKKLSFDEFKMVRIKLNTWEEDLLNVKMYLKKDDTKFLILKIISEAEEEKIYKISTEEVEIIEIFD